MMGEDILYHSGTIVMRCEAGGGEVADGDGAFLRVVSHSAFYGDARDQGSWPSRGEAASYGLKPLCIYGRTATILCWGVGLGTCT